MNLRDAYKAALLRIDYSEEPIILGSIGDFDPANFLDPECKIFVHQGDVYLISVPTVAHENAANFLADEVQYEVNRQVGGRPFWSSGSPDILLTNGLGCHPSFMKQPDASLIPYFDRPDHLHLPTVVLEVAVHHESLFMLLLEGKAWM